MKKNRLVTKKKRLFQFFASISVKMEISITEKYRCLLWKETETQAYKYVNWIKKRQAKHQVSEQQRHISIWRNCNFDFWPDRIDKKEENRVFFFLEMFIHHFPLKSSWLSREPMYSYRLYSIYRIAFTVVILIDNGLFELIRIIDLPGMSGYFNWKFNSTRCFSHNKLIWHFQFSFIASYHIDLGYFRIEISTCIHWDKKNVNDKAEREKSF